MALEAKINGMPMKDYTASPLKRLYERLSLSENTSFYTKKGKGIIRVELHPAYLENDSFHYRANILDNGKGLEQSLGEPRKEVLEIRTHTAKFHGTINIERDLTKDRIFITKRKENKVLHSSSRYDLNTSLDIIERFVRGLY